MISYLDEPTFPFGVFGATNFEPKHVLVGYATSASNPLSTKVATFFVEIVWNKSARTSCNGFRIWVSNKYVLFLGRNPFSTRLPYSTWKQNMFPTMLRGHGLQTQPPSVDQRW